MPIKKNKKRKVEITETGIAHIKAGFNNTLITITNMEGQTIATSSAGQVGYKGTKKSTPYVAAQAAQDVGRKAVKEGLIKVHVRVKGISQSKESAIRGLATAGLALEGIQDITPDPHNGCRPPTSPKG